MLRVHHTHGCPSLYLVFFLMALMLSVNNVFAETEQQAIAISKDISIPSSDLNDALLLLGELYETEILAPTELISGLRGIEVSGNFTLNEALNKTIQGTDLEVGKTSTGVLFLRKSDKQQNILGQSLNKESIDPEIEIINVEGARPSDYFTYGSASTLRSSVSIDELSRSLQIFNAEFIEDFQPVDIGDVATFASNVAFRGTNNGRTFVFNIRGFDAPLLNDGLLNTRGDSGFETYNLERIEVLKGPDSLQFGRADAGGVNQSSAENAGEGRPRRS
ncbi:MAG: TonB-dependent receptor plug domain-containing protein [Pseudomonadota bacterium]